MCCPGGGWKGADVVEAIFGVVGGAGCRPPLPAPGRSWSAAPWSPNHCGQGSCWCVGVRYGAPLVMAKVGKQAAPICVLSLPVIVIASTSVLVNGVGMRAPSPLFFCYCSTVTVTVMVIPGKCQAMSIVAGLIGLYPCYSRPQPSSVALAG